MRALTAKLPAQLVGGGFGDVFPVGHVYLPKKNIQSLYLSFRRASGLALST